MQNMKSMNSRKIESVQGNAVYLEGSDIDTDQIIPGRFLTCVTFDELGPNLFYDMRTGADGNLNNHILNQDIGKKASILFADHNFGCGSSREHAPQALKKFGFSAIVAGSYAEIFHSNCVAIGLPCAVLGDTERKEIQNYLKSHPKAEVKLDILNQQIEIDSKIYPCTMKKSIQDSFLEGTWDMLGTLMGNQEQTARLGVKLGYLNE